MNDRKLLKKLTASIIIFAALCICFCITTFALIYAIVTVEDNVFTTGNVDINLNGGKSIVYDPNLYLEPGMTVEKEFFIRNEGTAALYYKLYFNKVEGGLGSVIEVSITDGEEVLYSGKPDELIRSKVESVVKPLKAGEEKTLKIVLHYPEDADISTQEQSLSFDLHADAVQLENNDDTEFGEPETAPETEPATETESAAETETND